MQHHRQIVSQIKTERALNNRVQIKKTSTVKKFFPLNRNSQAQKWQQPHGDNGGDILLLSTASAVQRCQAQLHPGSLFGMVTDEQCDTPSLTRPAPTPPTRTRTNKASAKAKKRTRLGVLSSAWVRNESLVSTAQSPGGHCYSSLAFLVLSPPFSSAGAAASPSFRFPLSAGGCVLRGLKLIMMQVMLSQPVPSPEVSGAKH